jgi:ligand-binding sensor domain-containing protein
VVDESKQKIKISILIRKYPPLRYNAKMRKREIKIYLVLALMAVLLISGCGMVSKDTGPLSSEDPKNITIYAVTDDGLAIGSRGGENWENIHSAKKKGLVSNIFSGLVIADKTMYLSFAQGLSISTDNAKTWISVSYPAPLDKALINQILKPSDQIFLATSQGVFISTNNASTFFAANTQIGMVTKIAGQNGNFYAMNNAQLFVSTTNAQSWSSVALPFKAKINDIDFNGTTLMIGTDQGLLVANAATLANPSAPSFNVVKDTQGLPENTIQAVKVDDKNVIYVGTRQGLSVSKDLGKKWNTFTKTDGLESEAINAIEVFKGHLFLGTSTGVWVSFQNGQKWDKYMKGTGLRSNNVVEILAK